MTNLTQAATTTIGDRPAPLPADHPAPGTLLQSATALVEPELAAVHRAIEARLDSDIALIRTLGAHLIGGGGKRLRPLILLLSAKACRPADRTILGDDYITLAAVIEFIHTATLLHDDVVDASSMRRGRATANQVWGNQASVLVGDFLYSRSFEMMVELENMEVMRILAATTNAIAEGEVMQLLNAHSPDTTEQAYMDTIHRKTAKLFESAAALGAAFGARVGAGVGGAPAATRPALANYGLHLGTAFQLIDDILDYRADSDATGKNIGDDLAEGKPTLPLIYALQHAAAADKKILRRAIENGERECMDEVLAIVDACGALAYTDNIAARQSAAAAESLATLPDSPSKDALVGLAEFAVARGY